MRETCLASPYRWLTGRAEYIVKCPSRHERAGLIWSCGGRLMIPIGSIIPFNFRQLKLRNAHCKHQPMRSTPSSGPFAKPFAKHSCTGGDKTYIIDLDFWDIDYGGTRDRYTAVIFPRKHKSRTGRPEQGEDTDDGGSPACRRQKHHDNNNHEQQGSISRDRLHRSWI